MGLVLFSGPHFILHLYKYRNYFDNIRQNLKYRRPSEGFFNVPWDQVMSDRGDAPSWTDISKTILDSVHDADDICRSIRTRNLMKPLSFIHRHQVQH
jgi:hypothetical protein